MDRAEIASKLKDYLETQFPNQGVELRETTDLLEEWFVDSLGIMQTVLFIEESFGVEMQRADINGTTFANIATLADFIVDRQSV